MTKPDEKTEFALKLIERVNAISADIEEAKRQIEIAETGLDQVLDDLERAAYPGS